MIKKLIITADSIRPSREDFEVIGVFNPAVTLYKGQTIMLARVAERPRQDDADYYKLPVSQNKGIEILRIPKSDKAYDYSDGRVIKNSNKNYLTSISHFRVARSANGIDFSFDGEAWVLPDNIYEEYGIEDPRITEIEGRFYITYSAISGCGINVGLMVTDDFVKFEKLGYILHSDNKDCVLFPQKIEGKYFCLHRPSISHFGKPDIWIAESDNLRYWGNHKIMPEARAGCKDSERVGAGAAPLKTDKGWLIVYHGADSSTRYHLAAMLLDLQNPNKPVMRSKKALLEPTEEYEKSGFTPNVVFTCGMVPYDGGVRIYYGVCDENIAVADVTMEEIFESMEEL